MGREHSGPVRSVLSVVWALMPAYTFGLLAPAPFVHAAFRLRTRRMWSIAVGYGAAWLLLWMFIDAAGLGVALLLALAVVGTIHAFQLRRAVFALPPHPPRPSYGMAPSPARAAPEDAATACSRMRAELSRLTSYVRANPGVFPPACEQLIGEIVQHAHPLVAAAPADRRAGQELGSLQTILTEYLPESISRYVRLPMGFASSHTNADGKTPADELEVQLRLLRDGVREAAASRTRGDATRLHEQTAFLRSKFERSELDLP